MNIRYSGALTAGALASSVRVPDIRRKMRIALLVLLGLIVSSLPSFAGKVGTEFRINTTTAGEQGISSVAALSDGGFVVVWIALAPGSHDFGPNGPIDIYGQRFDGAGKRVGKEFRVNTYTARAQNLPCVAGLSDGGFVVIWESPAQDSKDGGPLRDPYGVYGQRFGKAGRPVGGEFRVNTYVRGYQGNPAVAALGGGGFVVTWESVDTRFPDPSSVYAQLYDGAGARVGDEFRVNTQSIGAQSHSSVAGLSDGGFVVTWQSFGQDGDRGGIYGQRYNNAGQPLGSEFLINTITNDQQDFPSVAGLSGGGFVVAWESAELNGDAGGLYGQRYNGLGKRAGKQFRINTAPEGFAPVTAKLSDGGFVVTWMSLNQDGSSFGVYGQRYDSAGRRVGKEFRINTVRAGYQGNSSVAGLSGGGFAVTWDSADGQDGDGSGVYAQIYGP